MATVHRTVRPLQPVAGSCKWLLRPILPSEDNQTGGNGVLAITTDRGTSEYLFRFLTDWRYPAGLGFELAKVGGSEAEVYHLPSDLSSCDCADATFKPDRPGGCKHMKALSVALPRLANPAPDQPAPPFAPAVACCVGA